MTRSTVPTWLDEFEASYAVPAEVTSATDLEDTSWHNDACPSFHCDASDLTLWVDHPVEAEREHSMGARFAVTAPVDRNVDPLYFGDDVDEALHVLRGQPPREVLDCGAPWRGDGGANGLTCLLAEGHEGNHRAEWADAEWTEAETKPEVTKYEFRVKCIAYVTDGEVTEVHLLAPMDFKDGVDVIEGTDNPEQFAALTDTFWAPLMGLPSDVVWEG
jgi:hypothetical protein